MKTKLVTFAVVASWTLLIVWLMFTYEFSDVGEPDDHGAVLAGYLERGFVAFVWLVGIGAIMALVWLYRFIQRTRSN